MDGKDKDQTHKPRQDIQDKRKDESSNPISHEDCHPILLEDGIFFNVSLGPRIFILKSIGGQIILSSHYLLKDEEAIDCRRGFPSFHWTRGTSLRRGDGRLTKCVDGVCFFSPGEQRRRRSV
jgi:hypothetical protein